MLLERLRTSEILIYIFCFEYQVSRVWLCLEANISLLSYQRSLNPLHTQWHGYNFFLLFLKDVTIGNIYLFFFFSFSSYLFEIHKINSSFNIHFDLSKQSITQPSTSREQKKMREKNYNMHTLYITAVDAINWKFGKNISHAGHSNKGKRKRTQNDSGPYQILYHSKLYPLLDKLIEFKCFIFVKCNSGLHAVHSLHWSDAPFF